MSAFAVTLYPLADTACVNQHAVQSLPVRKSAVVREDPPRRTAQAKMCKVVSKAESIKGKSTSGS